MAAEVKTLVVTLPWPPRELSPNARVHWAKKAKAAKAYRQTAWALTKAELGRDRIQAARLSLVFHPPSRRRMDIDNMLASVKAGIDGISDATGIDDSNLAISLVRREPKKGGEVVAVITEGERHEQETL